ncbi:MAG: hypothetical protein HKM04_05575 [Legionellales bacterium]|nr:hypothetical protein [Legionellales bacterium]
MEINELIQEVAKRHHVILNPSDPIFATVTLNELVLAGYLEKMQSMLDVSQDKTAASCAEQITTSKVMAEKLVTQTSTYVTENVKKHLLEAGEAMRQEFQSALNKLSEEKLQVHQSQRQAMYISLAAVAVITLLGGVGIGTFFF